MKTKTDVSSNEEITVDIHNAVRLHGHLGPFLVIGVKMSRTALERLTINKKNKDKLQVKTFLESKVPFTCTLDGVQATTNCTFGNRKLIQEETNTSDIKAIFYIKDTKNQVTIQLKEKITQELTEKLRKAADKEKVQTQLAGEIAAMPIEDLFLIEN